jgi:hypothetical protein
VTRLVASLNRIEASLALTDAGMGPAASVPGWWSTARAIPAPVGPGTTGMAARRPTGMARPSATAWRWGGRCRAAGAGMTVVRALVGPLGLLSRVLERRSDRRQSLRSLGKQRRRRRRRGLGQPLHRQLRAGRAGRLLQPDHQWPRLRLRRTQHQRLHWPLDRRGRRRALQSRDRPGGLWPGRLCL